MTNAEDFGLSEELLAWRATVRDFFDREIGREYVRNCDQNREYPYEAYSAVAKQGWLGLTLPEQFGGAGGDVLSYIVMLQELGRYSVDFGVIFALPMFTVTNIVNHGRADQQERYLAPFINGDVRFSISITEPEAGSDVAAVSTRADMVGDTFVVNGTKMYSSAAHVRDNVICALVRTDPKSHGHEGLSVLLIPNDSKGLTITRLPTVARRATGTTQLFFEDVEVPQENLLGELGHGWDLIMEHLEHERLSVSALYASNAQQAVDDALAYAKGRVQFGKPIGQFQVIKHDLAQMQTDADAATLMVMRAAHLIAKGRPALREVSMAKLFASETLYKVASEGMQILGGAAQLPEMDMERFWREGKQGMVGGGSSQIQRSIIAKSMGL
jgi:alkylation response protein AidB-like acyl-CoA dehydrogenase